MGQTDIKGEGDSVVLQIMNVEVSANGIREFDFLSEVDHIGGDFVFDDGGISEQGNLIVGSAFYVADCRCVVSLFPDCIENKLNWGLFVGLQFAISGRMSKISLIGMFMLP